MGPRILSLCCFLLTACGPPAVSTCDLSTFRAPQGGTTSLGFGGDAGVSWPELRGLPATLLSGSDAADLDVAFVGEGFTAAELADYQAQVARFVREVAGDDLTAIVGPRFSFHRIDLTSPSSLVGNADIGDTPLGACLERDPKGEQPWIRLGTAQQALEAVASSVPGVDVLVVLVNRSGGRANADLHLVTDRWPRTVPIVRMDAAEPTSVLTHELGHALFRLADEYTDIEEALPASHRVLGVEDPLALSANVSIDPQGAKWAHIVSGSREGGLRYRRGAHHAVDECRMNAGLFPRPFCPVCRAHIRAVLEVLSGAAPAPPLQCGVSLNQDPLALDEEAARSLVPVITSWTGGLVTVRPGCEPCPPERSPNLIRAGAGFIYRDPPAGWSPHRLGCEMACRYPGDDALDARVSSVFGLEGMPVEGELEVTCFRGTERRQTKVPYRMAP
jgi:hypothetical protein